MVKLHVHPPIHMVSRYRPIPKSPQFPTFHCHDTSLGSRERPVRRVLWGYLSLGCHHWIFAPAHEHGTAGGSNLAHRQQRVPREGAFRQLGCHHPVHQFNLFLQFTLLVQLQTLSETAVGAAFWSLNTFPECLRASVNSTADTSEIDSTCKNDIKATLNRQRLEMCPQKSRAAALINDRSPYLMDPDSATMIGTLNMFEPYSLVPRVVSWFIKFILLYVW
jgi:hypothetical protein